MAIGLTFDVKQAKQMGAPCFWHHVGSDAETE